MIHLLNYPIYSRISLTTEYERVLTVFLDDVPSKFIKQFSSINNMVLGLLLCHVLDFQSMPSLRFLGHTNYLY